MKVVTVFILSVALLALLSFQFLKTSEASDYSFAKDVPSATTPTPYIKTGSPTPVCSPMPAPALPEEEKKYPFRELALEDAIDLGLGTNDWDCDGISNIKDNCVFVYNPDQNTNTGGKPIACDPDIVGSSFQDSRCDQDQDGIPDFRDNCLLACNPDQRDLNKNGIGDVCDRAFPNAILTLSVCEKRRKIEVLKPQKNSNRKKN